MILRIPRLQPELRARVIDWLDDAAADIAADALIPEIELASALIALADALRQQPHPSHHHPGRAAHHPERTQ